MRISRITGVVASCLVLSACVEQPPGPEGYGGQQVGYGGGCNAPGTNTLIGAGAGALGGGLIGNLASGRRHEGRNTLLGAVGGAAVGGLVGASTEHPCPPPPPAYPAPYGVVPGPTAYVPVQGYAPVRTYVPQGPYGQPVYQGQGPGGEYGSYGYGAQNGYGGPNGYGPPNGPAPLYP